MLQAALAALIAGLMLLGGAVLLAMFWHMPRTSLVDAVWPRTRSTAEPVQDSRGHLVRNFTKWGWVLVAAAATLSCGWGLVRLLAH